jgi:hypothetical protein
MAELAGEEPLYTTYAAADAALAEALLECARGMGEAAAEAANDDIVRAIAQSSSPAVAAELLRRQLINRGA